MSETPDAPPRRPSSLPAIVGLALVLVGIAALAVGALTAPSASFGWFAYAPLSGVAFAPSVLGLVTPVGLAGAGAVLVGAVLVAYWLGARRWSR